MKTPADFRNQEEWLTFVRSTVLPGDIAYTLAMGRTRMFQRFYELRQQHFPAAFVHEVSGIAELREPQRTAALEALNERIFADITQFLFTATSGKTSQKESIFPTTPHEIIDELLGHLRTKNPYYALWHYYATEIAPHANSPEWSEYLVQELHTGTGSELEFAQLIGELGRCLQHYRAKNQSLPRSFYFRIWFLHNIDGPERNPMTRALVQELLEDMRPCTFA
jgi:hypothetical protein